jgi:hypothetical protein
MMRLCETNFAQLPPAAAKRRTRRNGELSGEQRAISVNDYRINATLLVEIEQTAAGISWSLPSMMRCITTRWSLKCVQASRSFASKRGMIIRIKSCINATKSIKLTSFSRLAKILFSTWSNGDSGLLAS